MDLKQEKFELRLVGYAILTIRFVQGWIFWGGGSRRFIYAPEKLDPNAPQWMANKMQAAMPGAILGAEEVINFLLQHFYLLYPAIIIFSLVELICGINLILGFFTRISAFITVLLSITLMVLFGWQGGTCMDEWTMAVSNVAIGMTLVLSGSSIYSIDGYLLRRHASLTKKSWFYYLASGPESYEYFKRLALICFAFVLVFTLGTYNYYRGAILSKYHQGPVSATTHHLALSQGMVSSSGAVSFFAYVNAGTPSAPIYIMHINLIDDSGNSLFDWGGKELTALSSKQINNTYLYNQFKVGKFGLEALVGAKAMITLKPAHHLQLKQGNYYVNIELITGKHYQIKLNYTQ